MGHAQPVAPAAICHRSAGAGVGACGRLCAIAAFFSKHPTARGLPPREAAVSPPPVAATTVADDAAADNAAAGEAASAQEMLEAVLRHLERHGHSEAAAGVRSAFRLWPPRVPN